MVINLPNYERQTTILNNTNTIITNLNNLGFKRYVRTFPATGTFEFVVPTGVTNVFVSGCGAGGSGASGTNTANVVGGNAGGTTTLGSLFTWPGGGGGSAQGTGGAPGGKGGEYGHAAVVSGNIMEATKGGSVWNFKGGYSGSPGGSPSGTFGGFGCGGGGTYASGFISACGGSGHGSYNRSVNVTPGSTITVTIGKGGDPVINQGVTSGAGGDGYLEIEWWAK